MAQVLVTESYLEDIADAIREKNGTENTYTPAQMAAAVEAIPDPSTLVQKSITSNGNYDPSSDSADGYSSVSVNVPNTYTQSDEGKVVSSGALVEQTGRSVTKNGTYDTTENNEVIVNVSDGSSDGFMKFDFTKARGNVKNVTYGSTGAVFNDVNDYILMPFGMSDMTIEIDVSTMQLTSGTHRRFIMGTNDKGLIYRSTGKWAFYAGAWQDFAETDGSLFDNSTVRIYVDENNYWHIYKDGILLWEPATPLALNAGSGEWYIGANGYSINNATITEVRLYDGEYTG